MIELTAEKPTYTAIAVTLGAVMLASQISSYPLRVEPYEVQQVSGTYSGFMERLGKPAGGAFFAQQMIEAYSSLAQRQERLGAEFEAAIFGDLDSLYEV